MKNKVPRKQDYQAFVPANIRRIIARATKSNPAERYQSALEVRRALEGIALHGYWTTDSGGEYIGYFNNQTFRFECKKLPKGLKFTPYRRRLETGNENKIVRLAGNNLSKKECQELLKCFMLSVVNGDI